MIGSVPEFLPLLPVTINLHGGAAQVWARFYNPSTQTVTYERVNTTLGRREIERCALQDVRASDRAQLTGPG